MVHVSIQCHRRRLVLTSFDGLLRSGRSVHCKPLGCILQHPREGTPDIRRTLTHYANDTDLQPGIDAQANHTPQRKALSERPLCPQSMPGLVRKMFCTYLLVSQHLELLWQTASPNITIVIYGVQEARAADLVPDAEAVPVKGGAPQYTLSTNSGTGTQS